jgi:hypothetical protein
MVQKEFFFFPTWMPGQKFLGTDVKPLDGGAFTPRGTRTPARGLTAVPPILHPLVAMDGCPHCCNFVTGCGAIENRWRERKPGVDLLALVLLRVALGGRMPLTIGRVGG